MVLEVKTKRWGNSLGVILPKEMLEKRQLKENEKIGIKVFKEADLTSIFGSFKSKKSGQAFKNMVRRGWEK